MRLALHAKEEGRRLVHQGGRCGRVSCRETLAPRLLKPCHAAPADRLARAVAILSCGGDACDPTAEAVRCPVCRQRHRGGGPAAVGAPERDAVRPAGRGGGAARP
eukprot:5785169-Prymnesium_polylepis.2